MTKFLLGIICGLILGFASSGRAFPSGDDVTKIATNLEKIAISVAKIATKMEPCKN